MIYNENMLKFIYILLLLFSGSLQANIPTVGEELIGSNNEKYKVIKSLGNGDFGEVFLVEGSNGKFAAKFFFKVNNQKKTLIVSSLLDTNSNHIVSYSEFTVKSGRKTLKGLASPVFAGDLELSLIHI